MGYQTGDFDNSPSVYTQSESFETKEQAEQWVLEMYHSGYEFDCSYIEDMSEEQYLAQIDEYEQQEQTRLELGIPKNLF